jgi:hypothetical protein
MQEKVQDEMKDDNLRRDEKKHVVKKMERKEEI